MDGGIIRNSGEAFTNILTVKTQFTAEKEWKLTEQGETALPGKAVLYLYRFEEDDSRSEEGTSAAISNAYQVPVAEGSAEIVSVALQENDYASIDADGKQHISLSGLDEYSKNGKKYVYFMKEVMTDFQTINGTPIKYTVITETLTDDTYTANVRNYMGSIPYESMNVKKRYVIGGDENVLYDAHMVLVKNTPPEEEGADRNQKYYFKSFDKQNNINIYTTNPDEAFQVTLNEKNNWYNTIDIQYGTSSDLYFGEYTLVKDTQHSYTVDYSNVPCSADGTKWTGATVSTDKQVYAVTIEKQSDNKSYLVTNQRVGDVEATIIVKWHEGTFVDETRPDIVNYTLTRSDGAAYHLKADKNTGMVTITDGDGKETSVPMQVEGDQWTFVLGGPENKGLALPKYTSDTAVTVSYLLEEDGRDISNKVITFNSENGNYTAAGKLERYSAVKTKSYTEAPNRDHDKTTVTFEHILEKKVGKTFYKVWCDKDVKSERQSPVLTLYSTTTLTPESDKDYSGLHLT